MGRLLITLLLVERGVLPTPLLYLSAYFEATRQEYYALRSKLTKETSRLPERMLELFVENPFWTVRHLAKRLAFTIAQRAVARLEAVGIVALATESRRNRVYCAREVMEILEESPTAPAFRRPRRRGKRA